VHDKEREDNIKAVQGFCQAGAVVVVYLLVGDIGYEFGRAGACEDRDRVFAGCEGRAKELGRYV
jgi:hypothetical protein